MMWKYYGMRIKGVELHLDPKNLAPMMALFSKPADSGDRYLAALKAYQRVFFAEEEGHIRPFLEEAVEKAKILADQLSLEDLIEALSRGVRLGVEPTCSQWIFVPSYWISPLVSFDRINDERCIIYIWGASTRCIFGVWRSSAGRYAEGI